MGTAVSCAPLHHDGRYGCAPRHHPGLRSSSIRLRCARRETLVGRRRPGSGRAEEGIMKTRTHWKARLARLVAVGLLAGAAPHSRAAVDASGPWHLDLVVIPPDFIVQCTTT